MDKSLGQGEWSRADCTIASALDVVGTRGALLVMREASLGTRRYADFVARTGLSEPTVAARLRELADAGLLARRPYQQPGERRRDEYVLTAKGRDLVPVLVALRQWGDAHAAGAAGPPLHTVHRSCGAEVTVALICDAGHRVGPTELAAVAGPGALHAG